MLRIPRCLESLEPEHGKCVMDPSFRIASSSLFADRALRCYGAAHSTVKYYIYIYSLEAISRYPLGDTTENHETSRQAKTTDVPIKG
jgi:hypothetical protein